ncbi:puromycin-sensitive aminopeptidase-like [Ctenocephalides felis]|uniref:puromycin-sensitive aminopeptidase-like n=1 Tax=Ctenocephalides felis TaxID=7515 RepID=UPI000E6E4697|nr:puromycin-sensitive aminopeptidase-like [Ctenocephalides felis]
MKTWIEEPGFPLVIVKEERKCFNSELTITQEKFSGDTCQHEKSPMWIIPIAILVSTCVCKPVDKVLLDEFSKKITLTDLKCDDYIVINPQCIGYYKVQYQEEMLVAFRQTLRYLRFPLIERLGVISDAYSLTVSGKKSMEQFLGLLRYYTHETNYLSLKHIDNCIIDDIYRCISGSECTKDFDKFVHDLFSPVRRKLIKWNPDPEEDIFKPALRSLFYIRFMKLGDGVARQEALSRQENLQINSKPLHPDISEICYTALALDTNVNSMEKLIRIYKKTENNDEKSRILSSMGKVTDSKIMDMVLEFMTSEDVQPKDFLIILKNLTDTDAGRNASWCYFVKNRQMFLDKCQEDVVRFLVKLSLP